MDCLNSKKLTRNFSTSQRDMLSKSAMRSSFLLQIAAKRTICVPTATFCYSLRSWTRLALNWNSEYGFSSHQHSHLLSSFAVTSRNFDFNIWEWLNCRLSMFKAAYRSIRLSIWLILVQSNCITEWMYAWLSHWLSDSILILCLSDGEKMDRLIN